MTKSKELISFIIIILSFQTALTSQSYEELMKSWNYVPNLIEKNIEWPNLLDSVRLNYPDKLVEISHIQQSVDYINSNPILDSIGFSMNQFLDPVSYKGIQSLKYSISKRGNLAIEHLIPYLSNHAATRIVVNTDDFDEPKYYYCLSDIAMEIIEGVSGIYFFRDFVHSNKLFSRQSKESQNEIITIVSDWYSRTKKINKSESINSYLNDDSKVKHGSKLYTAKNLAESGDTLNAIKYLKQYYSNYKMPCRSNMHVANMINDLGEDIALEDCLHDIYDYRCMADNGVQCVWYIIKNAKSHIPFDVLADIVSTERYSRYKRSRTKFIWHMIFNEMAITKTIWSNSILIELLRIKSQVKDSKIVGYYWERLYPKQFQNNYRVCDFSLLKLAELNPNLVNDINWENREAIDIEINRVLELNEK